MPDPCDICGAEGSFSPALEVSVSGVFAAEVHRCSGCGFRQIRPRLTPAELQLLYSDHYFDPAAQGGFGNYATQQQREERDAFRLSRALGLRLDGARVLEVGCALGFFLDGLRRHSRARVQGIDVSTFAAYFAARQYGLDVRATTLEDARFPDASFDLVVQKDLLEHVREPRAHLLETRRVLKPGGLTWLVTPNGEANLRPLVRRAAEERAHGSGMLPALRQGHVSFFSRANLVALFGSCGFEVVHLRAIHVKRGLRDLGFLPRQRRKESVAPAGRSRGAHAPPASSTRAPGRWEALHDVLAAAVEQRKAGIRASRAYFRYRAAMSALDRLPGRLSLGLDFECLLRRT